MREQGGAFCLSAAPYATRDGAFFLAEGGSLPISVEAVRSTESRLMSTVLLIEPFLASVLALPHDSMGFALRIL